MAVKLMKEKKQVSEAISPTTVMKAVEMILMALDFLSKFLDKVDSKNPKYNKVKDAITTINDGANELKTLGSQI